MALKHFEDIAHTRRTCNILESIKGARFQVNSISTRYIYNLPSESESIKPLWDEFILHKHRLCLFFPENLKRETNQISTR